MLAKIAALVIATPPSFMVASANIPGSWEVPSLLLFSGVSVLLLFAPALLDKKLGPGSERSRIETLRGIEAALNEM